MDQVQVLSAVCKRLNGDVESLMSQMTLRQSALAQIDANQQSQDDQLRQFNMDLQIKLSRTDAIIQKLQGDTEHISHGLRDAINGQQELNRSIAQRHQELKAELSSLSQRIERMFNEQQVVLRTFETDTARALATADSRARAFVDELRTEIFQSKAQKLSERERAEQRITQKIDEVKRSLENYDRYEKRIEDAIRQFERKNLDVEDHYKRSIHDLNRNVTAIEQDVYKRFDDRYQRTVTSLDKVKKEMRACFETLESSVETLQRITDSRIKGTEEKLERQVQQLRRQIDIM
ncbi:unnamed protein product [Adineta ricciae]|uniref:Uncharacterized protein n=1 Tax=Adineta ricciae TaxID=249248 RepID=A0A813P7F1_ADIRI|nr:unnamed protein product [Adineta ricciae]CAF1556363.1 unnamed protein product [Adineta ricciae]